MVMDWIAIKLTFIFLTKKKNFEWNTKKSQLAHFHHNLLEIFILSKKNVCNECYWRNSRPKQSQKLLWNWMFRRFAHIFKRQKHLCVLKLFETKTINWYLLTFEIDSINFVFVAIKQRKKRRKKKHNSKQLFKHYFLSFLFLNIRCTHFFSHSPYFRI